MMRNTLRWMLLGPLLMLALIACKTMSHDEIKGRVDTPAPIVEPSKYIFHRVKPGETMATISRWYTGKDGNWKAIAEENPDLKPFGLKKDDIVKVPTALATYHLDPPSGSTAPRKKPKKATSSPDKGGAEDDSPFPGGDEEAVFGPK
ncbi:MAG: hypothetical protein AB9873_19940 [Syntrophobacteraceae bacterium]